MAAFRYFFLLVAIFTSVLALSLARSSLGVTPYTCQDCFQVFVGLPSDIAGPGCCMFDNPVSAINVSGHIRAFTSNQEVYLLVNGPTFDSVLPNPEYVGLGPGQSPSDLDHCGAWLNAVAVDIENPSIIHGFYHEEWNCDYAQDGYTNKSIAYAESVDGGLNFTKPGYPNNQIILPPPGNTTTIHQTGEGDHSVAITDDYYYLYFTEWDPPSAQITIGLARASLSSGGRPGTWLKYFNGEFSEPGVGGASSQILGISGSNVLFRQPTKDFISLGNQIAWPSMSLGFSDDGINWFSMMEPLIHSDQNEWNRDVNSSELLAYPSLLGAELNNISDDFELFYTYLQPGETFQNRYLARRSVSLNMIGTSLPQGAPQVIVSLGLYCNKQNGVYWATTAMIPDSENYALVQNLGGIMTAEGANRTVLYDCYISTYDDHMVALQNECISSDEVQLRTLGWVFSGADDSPYNSVIPLYRCFDPSTHHHAVSLDASCSGLGTTEFILGYIIAT